MRFQHARAVAVALSGGAIFAAAPLARASGALPESRAEAIGPAHRAGALTVLSPQQAAREFHEFYFTRGIYSDGRGRFGRGGYGRGGGSWATDFPKADQQFMVVLNRLIDIDNSPLDNAVDLADPAIRRFPFVYILETGRMDMTDEQVQGLRSYLLAGGFLVVDDIWGPYELANLERELARVFPERRLRELPLNHSVFNNVYDVSNVIQVPNVRIGQMHGQYGTPTNEGPGSEVPHVFGMDDDRGELMVLVNWNTDIGDAWEWAENPYYPLKFSTYAFEIGVNMIVYAMSH
jgi:hypothetical protein